MNNLNLLTLAVFALLCAACGNVPSEDVAQKDISTNYMASYSEDSNKLTASAWFIVGSGLGTYVDLENGSTVSFDGEPLSRSTSIFHDITYDYNSLMDPSEVSSAPISFQYKDNSGTSYSNIASIPAKVNISNAAIGVSGDLGVSWNTSEALSNRDSLSFQLTNLAGDSSLFTSDYGATGSGMAVFKRASLANFTSSTGLLQVCRKRSVPTQAPLMGGSFYVSYCSRTIGVKLRN